MNEAQKFIDELTLPPTKSDAPSVYAFSLHKSGSTLLYNMLSELAPHTGLAYFSIQDQMFAKGIPPTTELPGAEKIFKPEGYLYGGFRFFPNNYVMSGMEEKKKIILVRNPLDALVSMYFSAKASHKIPERGGLRDIWKKKRKETSEQSLEEFILTVSENHKRRMLSYLPILGQDNCKLYRYEDIIYYKKEFLQELCLYFDWHVKEDVIAEIAKRNDILPKLEDETKHVRQVHPGNYRKQLNTETIKTLETQFEDILVAFGYKPNAKTAYQLLK